ncbi:peptidase S9 family protein [Longibacter salinarum]|uniref:Peptidase S9 family protein n=1 Tax=Longibacter salinarum TaxID=1850348 RepID=A0A2A8CYG3_9BACT|nr:S9 family peptidase [Longibacter salinarum]PEN13651.1 peptidase S9 family protein [Longibacter salinarum]
MRDRIKPRFPLRSAILGVLISVFALSTPDALAQYATDSLHFELTDVFALEYASDPQIHPSGESIIYARTSMDRMTDRAMSRLWIVAADGRGHRPVTAPDVNASSPRWSPSGDRIAYVASDGDDGSEIYVRWMESGETARITQLVSSPSSLSWSPDGSHIAFSMLKETPQRPFARMPAPPEGAEWAPRAKVIDDVRYRSDGAGYLKDGHRQVFIVPDEGGTPRQITSGPYDHGGSIEWMPDGSAIVLSANRSDDAPYDPLDSELYLFDLQSSSITSLTSRQGPDSSPAISPDGSRIAYTGFDDAFQGYQVTRLHVLDLESGEKQVITADLERDVQNPTWSADGETIYVQYDDEGTTKVGAVSMNGRVREVVTNVGGTTLGRPYPGGSFSVAANGRIAFTQTGPHHPADVAVTRGQGVRRLTQLNQDLSSRVRWGAVEDITYTSTDGAEIEGWIVTPPDFDPSKKYPLMLEIHGGPYANYGPRFSAEAQLYAAAGYVVLYTNPRGSTSYGESFGNAIHKNYPGPDYDDLMAGVDAVIDRGGIDTSRLYVTGGSGGGILTAWIVGKTDRFRAAVAAKPVINWYSFVLTSDGYPFYTKYWFSGPPWEHLDEYMDHSPISLIGNVTTPTMLLTGEEDFRTPMSETEQFYQALQLQKVETVMVRIPGASHGIAARPSHLMSKVAHILEWFDRHGARGGR